MRILQLISSSGQYGAENVLLELVTSLKKIQCESLVGVFENEHRPNTEIANAASKRGLSVERVHCGGRFDRKAVEEIQLLIRRCGIDLVHSHGYKSNLYGYWGARREGIPIVASCHGWMGKGIRLRSYYLLDRLVLRRFDHLVAVSDQIASALRWAAIPQRKVSVIDNGINVALFSRPCELPARNGERPIRIGVVARLAKQKGIPYMLQAAREILRESPNTEFFLVGDGPERGNLERVARQLGIEKNVIFAGSCTDMPRIYNSFDIFALASVDEGLPMALLEAMASRLPVLVTNVGAVCKVVRDGETGLLAPSRDPAALARGMRELISSPDLRSRLGDAAFAKVQNEFSSEAMMRRYAEVYRKVLKRPAEPHADAEVHL
jgi:glycosyltransferase involved in cell wall biosynthesis